jgi:hypothetical protein
MTDHPCLEYPAPAAAATPVPVMGAWVELVCGDAGLLRAEFDAIIAANFPGGAGNATGAHPCAVGTCGPNDPGPGHPRVPPPEAPGPPRPRSAPDSTIGPGNAARPRIATVDGRPIARQVPHTHSGVRGLAHAVSHLRAAGSGNSTAIAIRRAVRSSRR